MSSERGWSLMEKFGAEERVDNRNLERFLRFGKCLKVYYFIPCVNIIAVINSTVLEIVQSFA